jgi:hypothetical protein
VLALIGYAVMTSHLSETLQLKALLHFPADLTSSSRARDRARNQPGSLGDRAAEDLRFIRDAMARSTTFTPCPAWAVRPWARSAWSPRSSRRANRRLTGGWRQWLVAAGVAAARGTWGIVAKAKTGGPAAQRIDGAEFRHRS